MKKKALVVVALLLALSVTMAAMAYSAASVQNAASLSVVSTDTALLALKPSTTVVGNKDITAEINDGMLKFTFGKGHGGIFGVQRMSQYCWFDLFTVTNNSNETLECQFKLPMANFGEIMDIQSNELCSVVFSPNQAGMAGIVDNWGKGAPFTLQPGQTMHFRVDINTDLSLNNRLANLGTFNGNIVIVANAK